ncbi:aromatic motif membrane protein [Metamycoplasma gateae]|uniref:Aromatic motif membrane protein n=1 Tax=Metamycoplasma gateae TaxID=35769 RepID=A0ABZ2AGJ0_9BACT|nr:aromatic motif membrane protein [Metamycoplasma gateae]
MKKLSLISLLSIPLPLITISCQEEKTNDEFTKKQIKEFYKNPSITKMLDFFTNNDNAKKNIYVSQQQNKSNSKFDELKYAFVYNPIFIANATHNNGDYNFLANKSKDIIKNTLSIDWYWTLNNINKFDYNFNPYGDRYRSFAEEQEWFQEIKEKFNSLIINIKNNNPQQLVKVPIKEIEKLKSKNIYKEKEAWYLIFDDNKAIKIWKYLEDDKPKLQILPDLLIFKDIQNIKEQIIHIEDSVFKKRLENFNNNYESSKEDAELEDEPFDEEAFLNSRIDKIYMEFQGIYKYNENFVDVLREINKDELKIYRFSMRFINEKN